ncbi:MAG: ATP-binding cassette domain-containing protein, partial [Rhodobacteraceae bacterium]|nr:ATP-binding cassette domain-containing protein [Paracoccaceae bacterium]
MIVLKIADLRKSYNGKIVLDGLNFEVPKGEALSIIGSNGAGKSTLIKCALFLTKPDSGSIDIFDNRVNSMSQLKLRKMRSNVGVVFQKHNLVPRLSVL